MHLVWAGLATLPYLPGTVVPLTRTSEGLPLGVQVVGPRWGDRTTLAFASHVEQLTGGFVPPPGYE
jgi:amidase